MFKREITIGTKVLIKGVVTKLPNWDDVYEIKTEAGGVYYMTRQELQPIKERKGFPYK